MTEKEDPRTYRISPWVALAWGVAIDLMLIAQAVAGGLMSSIYRFNFYQLPILFAVILLLIPLFLWFIISLCNSPRYRHLTRD